MWDGLRYLAGHTVVLMSFVVDLIAMVFGMPRALFPQIAHELRRPRRRRFDDGAAGGGDVRRCRRRRRVLGLAAAGPSPRAGGGRRDRRVDWQWWVSACAAGGPTGVPDRCCGVRWRSSRSADAVHGAAAAVVGTTIAAAGGGGLVVVGVLIAALAVPAFVRYRVSTAGDQPVDLGNQSESAGYHPKRGGGRRGGDSGTA